MEDDPENRQIVVRYIKAEERFKTMAGLEGQVRNKMYQKKKRRENDKMVEGQPRQRVPDVLIPNE